MLKLMLLVHESRQCISFFGTHAFFCRERENSRFLTTGYVVSFTLYDLHKMDSRQTKMTDDRLQ